MRHQESGSACFPGEFWNTISNLPFVIIGLMRLTQYRHPEAKLLYILFVAIGVCSGLHHACPPGFRHLSLILDYIPIVASLYHGWFIIPFVSQVTWFKVGLALLVLVIDHLSPFLTRSGKPLVDVPFGHVFWHILAAFAVDSAYSEVFLGF